MTWKLNTIQITFFFFSLVLGSCKNPEESKEATHHLPEEVTIKIKTPKLPKYDYKVVGTDENGHHVHGSINIEGKIGLGTLIRSDTKEIEIVVEWIDKHSLMATDLEGYQYTLKFK